MLQAGFKAEIPKGFDLSKVEKSLQRGLYKTAQDANEEMQSFVANWKNKPDIAMSSKSESDGFTIRVFPTGDNLKYWLWVSFGTPPKRIVPVRAKRLSFRYQGPGVSYAPKTAPWGFKGGAGKKLGPVQQFNAVNWPGITPRWFEQETILAIWPDAQKRLDAAIVKGLKEAGS